MSVWNRSQEAIVINPGDRIAQYLVLPVQRVEFTIVDDFVETDRGNGGFGHTGTN